MKEKLKLIAFGAVTVVLLIVVVTHDAMVKLGIIGRVI